MKLALLFIAAAGLLLARPNYSGWCEQGNNTVSVPTQLPSTTLVQQSFPSCTVTVRDSGGVIATIYSDNSGTPLANPFTAASSGLYNFFADAGLYTVTLSGGGIVMPFAITVTLASATSGITSINSLTAASQTLATGTSGTDFAIVSATSTHTFNLPTASASNRGALSSTDWSTFNAKQAALTFTAPLSNTANVIALATPLAITYGGTNATTATNAFNNLSPLTTKGDVLGYGAGTNNRLAVGTNGQCLTADSAQTLGLAWANCGTGTVTHTGNLVTGRMVIGNGTADVTQGLLADETNNNVSTSAHGFVPKAPGSTSVALCGDGAWGSCLVSAASPLWYSYTVTAIANGVNGCANANGCWQVNGVLGANKAAALTQNVTLFTLPANGTVTGYRYKTATACSGVTTLKAGLGTSSSSDLYLVSSTGYNLKTAVSNTNVTTALPLVENADTAASVAVVSSLTTTVDNVDQIAAGCSWVIHVLWATLP